MLQSPKITLVKSLTDLPDLTSETEIGLDTETFDPDLKKLGPGPRRGSHMIGISVSTDTNAWYIPITHAIGENVPVDAVKSWFKNNVLNNKTKKIGHNISYDLDFLQESNIVSDPSEIHYGGPYEDTYTNELLLNEDKLFKKSLDAVSERRIGIKKYEEDIQAAAANRGYSDVKSELWRLDPEEVCDYAAIDAWLTLQNSKLQLKELEEQDLMKPYQMECDIIPILMSMRHNGVRVDKEKIERTKNSLKEQMLEIKEKMRYICGDTIEPWEAAHIGKVCDKLGLNYPRTFKTDAPSFTKEFLENSKEQFFQFLLKLRVLDKMIGTFLEGQLEKYIIGDHIHPIFRNDGTVTGRFSCENPNAQFFPARDEELAPLIRGCFIPDEDEEDWLRADYSQIEYRLLVHYARGPGSNDARQKYIDDRKLSYHKMTQQMLIDVLGKDIGYKRVKNLNFGMIYGQGVGKTAHVLNVSQDEAKVLRRQYDRAVPFAKHTMKASIAAVENQGFIRTIYGRRRRFEMWEPKNWKDKYDEYNNRRPALPKEEALKEYGPRIERSASYKGLNACLQGSAGEITKMAMIAIWKAGICNVIKPPKLTVHDELDIGFCRSDKAQFEAAREVKHLMETTTKLRIPIYAECEIGKSWGSLEEIDL